jgi:hypothetical protein
VAITGDRYLTTYEGHTIELVRDNWLKTLKLMIDGNEVAKASRVLPHDITLAGTFEHDGVEHRVVAKSVVHFPSATDTIDLDGQPLALTKAK